MLGLYEKYPFTVSVTLIYRFPQNTPGRVKG